MIGEIIPQILGIEQASFLDKKSRYFWERLGASFLDKKSRVTFLVLMTSYLAIYFHDLRLRQ